MDTNYDDGGIEIILQDRTLIPAGSPTPHYEAPTPELYPYEVLVFMTERTGGDARIQEKYRLYATIDEQWERDLMASDMFYAHLSERSPAERLYDAIKAHIVRGDFYPLHSTVRMSLFGLM